MKRMYVNLDTELERDLARYLEREGNHHGKRAEILRRALREFLHKDHSQRKAAVPIDKSTTRRLRILER